MIKRTISYCAGGTRHEVVTAQGTSARSAEMPYFVLVFLFNNRASIVIFRDYKLEVNSHDTATQITYTAVLPIILPEFVQRDMR